MITRSDALDDALDRLDGYGYLDAPGFTTHGPMGAETLSPSRAAETALPDDGATPAPAEIIGRAAEHRDTHAIKFTEACVREHQRRPDPVYLLAAQRVLDGLPPW